MTPPKLTDKETIVRMVREAGISAMNATHIVFEKEQLERFAHAIADLVNQQWQEMLSKQEPVAWCQLSIGGKNIAYFDGKPIIMAGKVGNYIHTVPLYTHPAPDHTAVMRQVYEVMGLMGADLICEAAHHAAKDRHESGERCPIQKRWHEAFAALKQALGSSHEQRTI